MINKIKILLFLFVTCSANVFAQNFHNHIVFKGGFEPTDTVYVFTKKEHLQLLKDCNFIVLNLRYILPEHFKVSYNIKS